MVHEEREAKIAKEVADLYALPEEKRTAKLMELQVRNTLTLDSIGDSIDTACRRLDSVEDTVKRLPCIGSENSGEENSCRMTRAKKMSKWVAAATILGTLLGSLGLSIYNNQTMGK